jgi:hypothetical protein
MKWPIEMELAAMPSQFGDADSWQASTLPVSQKMEKGGVLLTLKDRNAQIANKCRSRLIGVWK